MRLATLLFVCSASLRLAIRAEVSEFVLAVFNLEGTILLTDDACTHQLHGGASAMRKTA